MMSRYTYRGVEWIDLMTPTRAEVEEIVNDGLISADVAYELLAPAPEQRGIFSGGTILMILYFFANRQAHHNEVQELDVAITDKALITARYDTIESVEVFAQTLESDPAKDTKPNLSPAHLAAALLDRVYTSEEHEVELVVREVSKAQEEIFSTSRIETVSTLAQLGRVVVNMVHHLSQHNDVFEMVRSQDKQMAPNVREALSVIEKVHGRLMRRLLHAGTLLKELKEANNTLLSTWQEDMQRKLSGVAVTVLPATFFVGMLSMSPIGLESGKSWAVFFGVSAISLVVLSMSFLFAKVNKWL